MLTKPSFAKAVKPRAKNRQKIAVFPVIEPDYSVFDEIKKINLVVIKDANYTYWLTTLTKALWQNGKRPSDVVAELCANYRVSVLTHRDAHGLEYVYIQASSIDDAVKAADHLHRSVTPEGRYRRTVEGRA